jgi:hypothetical protein
MCWKLMLVLSEGESHSRILNAAAVARIADAFELPRDSVRADAALVTEWLRSEQALRDHLRTRHDWDSSMAPYYLFWLRGDREAEAPD